MNQEDLVFIMITSIIFLILVILISYLVLGILIGFKTTNVIIATVLKIKLSRFKNNQARQVLIKALFVVTQQKHYQIEPEILLKLLQECHYFSWQNLFTLGIAISRNKNAKTNLISHTALKQALWQRYAILLLTVKNPKNVL